MKLTAQIILEVLMTQDDLTRRLQSEAASEKKRQERILQRQRQYDAQMAFINPHWNRLQDELRNRYDGEIYVDSGEAGWYKVENAAGQPIWGGEIVLASWRTRRKGQSSPVYVTFGHSYESTYSRTTYSSSNHGDTSEGISISTHRDFYLSQYGFHTMTNRDPNPRRVLETYATVAEFLPVYQSRIASAL